MSYVNPFWFPFTRSMIKLLFSCNSMKFGVFWSFFSSKWSSDGSVAGLISSESLVTCNRRFGTMSVTPLQAFSRLHRTVNMVFKGDRFAIVAARRKIREEYDKNRQVEDPQQIEVILCCVCNFVTSKRVQKNLLGVGLNWLSSFQVKKKNLYGKVGGHEGLLMLGSGNLFDALFCSKGIGESGIGRRCNFKNRCSTSSRWREGRLSRSSSPRRSHGRRYSLQTAAQRL